jgi:polysaccharide export outer membrane protein
VVTDQRNRNKQPSCHRLVIRALSLLVSFSLVSWAACAADDPGPSATQPSPPSETAQKNPTAAEVPQSASSANDIGQTNIDLVASGGLMEALDTSKRLGVGDTVIFRVLEDQEDPKSLSVTDAGDLDVPELGFVHAVGKTCKELAFEIKPRLERTTYYHATVILGIQVLNKTISGRRVYLAGQVRTTGPQEIPAGETWTVSRAIMGAGGFTDYADKKKVRLVRAGRKGTPGNSIIVNVADIWEKGQTEKDLSVEPEDLIFVPGRAINF